MQAKNLLATILFVLCLALAATLNANPIVTRVTGANTWSTKATWLRTGTGNLTSATNSATVTGTNFSEVSVGDVLTQSDGTVIGTVLSIQSNTSLTLTANAARPQTNLAYAHRTLPRSNDDVTITGNVQITLDQVASINKLTLVPVTTSSATTSLSISGTNSLTVATTVQLNGENGSRFTKIFFTGAGSLIVGTNITLGNAVANNSANSATLDMTNNGTDVASTLKIGGAITKNADGGWVPGTAASSVTAPTVEYNGASAQVVNAALTYPNLVLSGGSKTFSANAVTILGSWTVDAATSLATNNPSVSVGGNVGGSGNITKGTGTVTLGGNWTNTGTFPAGINVTFNSSSTMAIPVQAYGTLGVVGPKTLAGDMSLTSLLLSTNARLSLGSNTLTVSSISGGSATSYVITDGSGLLKVPATASQTFPVGPSTSIYTPVTIAGTNRDWSVRVQNSFSGYPSTNMGGALKLIWQVTPSASATANVTFQFTESQVSFTAPATMDIYHYGPNWQLATNGNDVTVGGTAGSARTLLLSSQSQFSPFAASGNAAPLPIRLLSFSGRKQTSGALLSWATASESMNNGFEVQRSLDGVSFSSIGFVSSLAAGGNSTHTLSYSFSDNAPLRGRLYYRLKQLDLDGRAHLSQVVQLNAEKGGTLSIGGFYPSPVRSSAQVSVEVVEAGDLTLRIVSAGGTLMRNWKAAAGAGVNTLPLGADNLPAGTYFLQVLDAQGNSNSSRFVKQ